MAKKKEAKGNGASAAPVIEVHNPATGELIGEVPTVGLEECEAALARARRAQRLWAATSVEDRAQVILRFRDRLLDRLRHLHLLRPAFVVLQPPSNQTVRAQNLLRR